MTDTAYFLWFCALTYAAIMSGGSSKQQHSAQ